MSARDCSGFTIILLTWLVELDYSAYFIGKDMATPLLILLVLFTNEFNFAGGMGWYVT